MNGSVDFGNRFDLTVKDSVAEGGAGCHGVLFCTLYDFDEV
jgi:hypothetical protein